MEKALWNTIFWAKISILVFVVNVPLNLLNASSLKYTENKIPPSLNPIFADDMYSVRMTELLFERLVGWDKEDRPKPMLATKWNISPDKRSILFFLRKGVTWHDGKPFVAEDVVFTIKAMTNRNSQITDRYLSEIISNVKINGSHTLTVIFKKPLSKPLKWMKFKIIPKHRFSELPKRSDYFNQKPYGTGPFRFFRWVGKKVELKVFENHWRRKEIKLQKISLLAIRDKNIQTEVLRYGGLDAIVRARPKDIPLFEKARDIELHPYSTNDWWYIGLNHKHAALKDLRVRQALLYGVDRDSLRGSHLGDGQTISGPFSPNDPQCNHRIEARRQSIEKANQLLDDAGWKRRGNRGIRSKKGRSLRLRFLLTKSQSSFKSLVLALQGAWKKIGVQVDVIWLNDSKWVSRVFKRRKFDLVLHIWNFDELASIFPLFYSRGRRNYVGFSSPIVDRLLKKAQKSTDPVIYKAIYGKLHQVLHDELPYLFLWSLTNYSAVSSSLKHMTIHPFNYFHYAYQWEKSK